MFFSENNLTFNWVTPQYNSLSRMQHSNTLGKSPYTISIAQTSFINQQQNIKMIITVNFFSIYAQQAYSFKTLWNVVLTT